MDCVVLLYTLKHYKERTMHVQTTITVPQDVDAQAFFNAVQRAINSVVSATQTEHIMHVSAYVFNSNNEAIY